MQEIKIGNTVLSIEKVNDLYFDINTVKTTRLLADRQNMFLTFDEVKGLIEILTKELNNDKNH